MEEASCRWTPGEEWLTFGTASPEGAQALLLRNAASRPRNSAQPPGLSGARAPCKAGERPEMTLEWLSRVSQARFETARERFPKPRTAGDRSLRFRDSGSVSGGLDSQSACDLIPHHPLGP